MTDCPQPLETTMRLLGTAIVPDTRPSFAKELFQGRFNWDMIHPFPEQPADDKAIGDRFLEKTRRFLTENFDPNRIDAESQLPSNYAQLIREHGYLKMRLPKAYGGFELSNANMARVIELVASWCNPVAMSFSVHNYIGAPAFIPYMEDAAARDKMMKMVADGAISSLAATEDHGASNIIYCTTAVPTDDGSHYVINGEKVYIGNGPVADLLVVPLTTYNETKDIEVSIFMVPTDTPGFEVVSAERYMGMHGLFNGVLRLTDVKVPREYLVGKLGEGLKITLEVVTPGKMFIPAQNLAASKLSLGWSKLFSQRPYLDMPLSVFELPQAHLGYVAADIFAQESLLRWVTNELDRQALNLSTELNIAKFFPTTSAWKVIDDTVQYMAGRGYENAQSLADRHADPIPAERYFRDLRVHRIFGTTNDLVRLNIAQAVIGGFAPFFVSDQATGPALVAALEALNAPAPQTYDTRHLSEANVQHLVYIGETARRLAMTAFHMLVKYGGPTKIVARQVLMTAFANIGAELTSMALTLSRAESLLGQNGHGDSLQTLVNLYCTQSAARIEAEFTRLTQDHSPLFGPVSQQVMQGNFDWLMEGIITELPPVQ